MVEEVQRQIAYRFQLAAFDWLDDEESILDSLVGCALLALSVIGSASIIGAWYEKYAILGEVYPNWPRQLNLL
jgi:hypothetical protein